MLNNKLHFWINFLTFGYYNDLKFFCRKENNYTIKQLTEKLDLL